MFKTEHEQEQKKRLVDAPPQFEEKEFYCYQCGRKRSSDKMIRVFEDQGISFYICPEHLHQ